MEPSKKREFPKPEQWRVIVRFNDAVKLPYQDRAEKELASRQPALWQKANDIVPGFALNRLFDDEGVKLLHELSPNDPPLPYYTIPCASQAECQKVADAFMHSPVVKDAYTDYVFEPADPFIDRNPRSPAQGHLDAAPTGIDARFAWEVPGGAGGNRSGPLVHCAVVERGWNVEHEDLAPARIRQIASSSSLDSGDRAHGTATLGTLLASNNGLGGIGIVSAAQGGVAFDASGSGIRLSVIRAMTWLRSTRGEKVLLIPYMAFLHGVDSQPPAYIPIEADPVIADLIRIAVRANISVVIPAGSGEWSTETGLDLDRFVDGMRRRIFDPSNPSFVDSGAIMVGGATSSVPHGRIRASNFGSRVDCYAWGEAINTSTFVPGPDANRAYTTSFGSTSGASAIIAGAASAVLGMARERDLLFSPAQVRNILRDRSINTASANPVIDKIGVMPDLKRIANERILNRDRGFLPTQIFITPEFVQILGGIRVDGGGIIIGPNGIPIPVGPWDPLRRILSPAKQNLFMGLMLTELATVLNGNSQQVFKQGLSLMQQSLREISETEFPKQ